MQSSLSCWRQVVMVMCHVRNWAYMFVATSSSIVCQLRRLTWQRCPVAFAFICIRYSLHVSYACESAGISISILSPVSTLRRAIAIGDADVYSRFLVTFHVVHQPLCINIVTGLPAAFLASFFTPECRSFLHMKSTVEKRIRTWNDRQAKARSPWRHHSSKCPL